MLNCEDLEFLSRGVSLVADKVRCFAMKQEVAVSQASNVRSAQTAHV